MRNLVFLRGTENPDLEAKICTEIFFSEFRNKINNVRA